MANYRRMARRMAKQYGIDPNIFMRQINQESGFNPNAVSPAGAIGIAQIVPKWHPGVNPHNPKASLRYAAKWMSELVDQYGNYRDALSVYNSGRPWSEGRGISETRNYIASILNGRNPKPTGMPTGERGVGGFMGLPTLNLRTDYAAQYAQSPIPSASGLLNNQRTDIDAAARNPLAASQSALQGTMGLSSLVNYMSQRDQAAAAPIYQSGAMQEFGGGRIPTGTGRMGTPRALIQAMRRADRMGLNVREHPLYDPVDPVHVQNSLHYSNRAADISGSADLMARFFRWARGRYGNRIDELIYDPIGSVFNGQFRSGAYGGHGGHVHIGF